MTSLNSTVDSLEIPIEPIWIALHIYERGYASIYHLVTRRIHAKRLFKLVTGARFCKVLFTF